MPKTTKKYYRGSRDKYSVEQTAFSATLAAAQTTVIDVVPAVALQGMRKVKHLTVNCSVNADSVAASGVLWALMYVPQGMITPGLNVTTGQPLVEPNQFCMGCGVFDNNAGPSRLSTRLSRNLNSGDKISLLLLPIGGTGTPIVAGVVKYAITLQ